MVTTYTRTVSRLDGKQVEKKELTIEEIKEMDRLLEQVKKWPLKNDKSD